MEQLRRLAYLLTAGVALALSVAFVLPRSAPAPSAGVTLSLPSPIEGTASTASVDTAPLATSSEPTSTSVATSSVPASAPAPVRKKVTPVLTPSPTQPPPTLTQDEINATLSTAVTSLRGALVNIICYASPGSGVHSITGSGVFIDSKGIILTNAHIAQYFLFAERGVSCKIRAGSPASDQYRAALVYIPSKWIEDNAASFTLYQPSGTGERDFALVAVTGTLTSTPLPAIFPAMTLEKGSLIPDAPIVIGSYGAQFLASSQVQSSLFPTLVFSSVKAVYTFAKNTVDVLALGGSAAAQEGSSGGGVVDALGNLAGLLVTSTVEGDTSGRELNAISTSYISAEFARETGTSLEEFLQDPIGIQVENFAATAKSLSALLIQNIRL